MRVQYRMRADVEQLDVLVHAARCHLQQTHDTVSTAAKEKQLQQGMRTNPD